MLSVQNVAVRLGRSAILHDVSLTACAGSLTAIVGPNGSGKTTLLRALTGDVPFSGSATLNGRNIARADPADLAGIRAVVAQSTQLAFPFTVLEVVRLGLRHGGDALAIQALSDVGLGAHAGRDMQTLSGGEQSRVHLARALVQVWQPADDDGPRWFFLDEPVAALDIGHQLLVMKIARRFADAGGGVIAVMHDLNLSAMFADQIVLLHGGRVKAQGAPSQVLTNALLSDAYDCTVRVGCAPASGPWLVPQAMEA
ncbi:MAG: heme ABC transporter ATP-binding protein [Gemmobacter sp.]|nr:heme ABC transporter ATP-binding protein [Gemmobacter sp.]